MVVCSNLAAPTNMKAVRKSEGLFYLTRAKRSLSEGKIKKTGVSEANKA